MEWAIVGGFAVLLVGLVAFFLRSGGGAAVSSLPPGGRTRLVKDGFFVIGDWPRGTDVRCRARVNGTWRPMVAHTAGPETFVYTGATPTEVEIVDVVVDEAPSVPSVDVSPPSSDDGGSSFDGFPSAY